MSASSYDAYDYASSARPQPQPQQQHYTSVPELLLGGVLWLCGRAGYVQARAFGYAAQLAEHDAHEAQLIRQALEAQWPDLARLRERIERGAYADDRGPFNAREARGLRWLEWMRDHGHFDEQAQGEQVTDEGVSDAKQTRTT